MGVSPTTVAVHPTNELHELVGRISSVSTLPTVAVKIMEVANDPEAGTADLKHVVECDAALTARVLKTVNSAYFGLRTRIGSLQHAISLLGFNAVRNLTLTVSVSDIFKRESHLPNYTREDLWKHMLSVALCSRMIARRVRDAQFDDAFLAGLLHDIGIVLFDEHDHDRFRVVLEAVRPDRELHRCERDVFGFDHAELGGTVAEHWRFPRVVAERIRYHHEPGRCLGDARAITLTVALADFLCGQKEIGPVKVKYAPRLSMTLLSELGLGRNDLRVLWKDMDQELAAAGELFRL